MKINFTPYEQALTLKELGFDEMCVGYYQIFEGNVINFDTISTEVCERLYKKDNFIKAPLYQQAFRFFRKQYNIHCSVTHGLVFSFEINNQNYEDYPSYGDNWFKSHEEAELACLRKLIEIVNQNKDE